MKEEYAYIPVDAKEAIRNDVIWGGDIGWCKKVPISSLVAKEDTFSPQAQPAKVSDEEIEQMAFDEFPIQEPKYSAIRIGFIAGYKAALSNQSITD